MADVSPARVPRKRASGPATRISPRSRPSSRSSRRPPNIKTFRMKFDDPAVMESFSHEPGQVGQFGVFGVGESTFAITSKPGEKDYIQFSVMRAGEVTKAIHNLSVGDKVGIRAPMGCGFPVEQWKGKRILFVMGGIGSAALKATIEYCIEHIADYAGVSILYGATAPEKLHLPSRHRRVAEAQRHRPHPHHRPRMRRMAVRRGHGADGAGAHEPRPGRHHSHPVRSADHDQVRADQLHEAGFTPEADLHHAREADEVWDRDLWAVQMWGRSMFVWMGRCFLWRSSMSCRMSCRGIATSSE